MTKPNDYRAAYKKQRRTTISVIEERDAALKREAALRVVITKKEDELVMVKTACDANMKLLQDEVFTLRKKQHDTMLDCARTDGRIRTLAQYILQEVGA